MHNTVKNLLDIEKNIQVHLNKLNINNTPNIVAVSKTFKIDKILPLIEHGHNDFGENKVQEAVQKWTDIKKINSKIRLHMIGKLQTNKVKFAVQIFDYIHSVDNEKLAKKIANECKKLNKKIKIFIKIKIENESQKGGIEPNELENFYKNCTNELGLDIIGLMSIPPNDNQSNYYFSEMKKLKSLINTKELSMGMSSDYLEAIKHEATFIRIGSSIFGQRS